MIQDYVFLCRKMGTCSINGYFWWVYNKFDDLLASVSKERNKAIGRQ